MVHNISLNAFFNALLREWSLAHFQPLQETTTDKCSLAGYFRLPDPTRGETLLIPCRYRATTGRHLFTDRLMLVHEGECIALGFERAVDWCLKLAALTEGASANALVALHERVRQSDQNLRLSQLRLEPQLDHLFADALAFIEAEAALFSGHSIHPCPKDRGNMTEEQAQHYAPEYGNAFSLIWYSVDHRQLFQRCAGGVTLEDALQPLLLSEPEHESWRARLEPGRVLIPCHPFQQPHWQASATIARLREQGLLRWIGVGQTPWRATSSLRAIYSEALPWMLKFSLSVRLTNSVRHLQPEEVVRGAELCRVLDAEPMQALAQDYPQFELLREPVAAGLRDCEGAPIPETLMIWRDNPFQGAAADNTEVLATLLQDDPRNGRSRLATRLIGAGVSGEAARDWFSEYLDVAVGPLLAAQADYGVLFAAHQQNLVLQLDGIWPRKLYFRDCQGTGFTGLAVRKLGRHLVDLAHDSANLLSDDLGIRLFCYYLFINATFNVMSSLAAAGLVGEPVLIRTLREWLESQLARGPADDRAIRYLLDSEHLHAKGNFVCTMRALNENTLDDVFSIYHPFPNPLYAEA